MDGEALRVRIHNEFWSADAGEGLRVGERVGVIGPNGLILTVQRLEPPLGARARPPVHER